MRAEFDLRNFVAAAVQGLCDYPDDVRVTCESSSGKTVVLSVTTNPSDMALVIGRHGKNVHAIIGLMRRIAAKHRVFAYVQINEEPIEPSERAPMRPDCA